MRTTLTVLGDDGRCINEIAFVSPLNPYDPPSGQTDESETEPTRRSTRLPSELLRPTKYGLCILAILAIGMPLLLSPIVDGFRINPFAIVLLFVGMTIDDRSFRRFPWTTLACLAFVIGFFGECLEHSIANVWNWLPARSSPLLGFRLLCAVMGICNARMVWRCHRYHHVNPCET
ncbi:MAG: hypothetical protein AAGI63_18505 [Planctomycetota bacterium]